MKHRFMIHALNHTYLVVDITSIGPPTEIYPEEGKEQWFRLGGFRVGTMRNTF